MEHATIRDKITVNLFTRIVIADLKWLTVFEIALVRLSETSDYLHGQVNNPSAVIRGTSENLQPDCTVPTSDQTPLKLIQIWARRMTQSTA